MVSVSSSGVPAPQHQLWFSEFGITKMSTGFEACSGCSTLQNCPLWSIWAQLKLCQPFLGYHSLGWALRQVSASSRLPTHRWASPISDTSQTTASTSVKRAEGNSFWLMLISFEGHTHIGVCLHSLDIWQSVKMWEFKCVCKLGVQGSFLPVSSEDLS